MKAFLSIGMMLCGGTLAVIASAILAGLPPVAVATFPVGFTSAHFVATSWLFIGALGMGASVISIR